MKIQILVATINQKDHSILEKMNIQSDVIVGNQCDHNDIEAFKYKEHEAIFLNFAEKGVGLNRNNALLRASGDICVFSDDDLRYVNDYPSILEKAFLDNPKADVIIFNLLEKNSQRKQITKKIKINRFNYLRYGTARISIRLNSIRKNAIFFNVLFGGGTTYCHGEDNLFLTECLNKKLKIIGLPITIAELTNSRESTWNNGYNEKYISDQGFLYKTISRRWWKFLCLQDCLRRHKSYGMSTFKSYRLMTKKAKEREC